MRLQESPLLPLLLALGCDSAGSFLTCSVYGGTASPSSSTIFISRGDEKLSAGLEARQSRRRWVRRYDPMPYIIYEAHACVINSAGYVRHLSSKVQDSQVLLQCCPLGRSQSACFSPFNTRYCRPHEHQPPKYYLCLGRDGLDPYMICHGALTAASFAPPSWFVQKKSLARFTSLQSHKGKKQGRTSGRRRRWHFAETIVVGGSTILHFTRRRVMPPEPGNGV